VSSMRRHIVPVGLAVLVAAGWCVYWLKESGSLPNFGGTYEVRAEVPRSSNLVAGASVRMSGIQVGQVTGVERDGRNARVTLEIDDEHGPIPTDSRIGVRLRTLVGENYLTVYPGQSDEELPDGGNLPVSQAEDYVDVDEILSVLKGGTRARARQFIRAAGEGVSDRGPGLNELLEHTTELTTEGSGLVDVLARDRKQVARLLDNFGAVTRTIGQRGQALQDMARGLRATFSAVAGRDEALRDTLRQMPATLTQVSRTSDVVRSTTGTLAPTLTNLAGAVRKADPAVELLEPAAKEGQRVLAGLSATAPPLVGTLGRVRQLAGPTAESLPEVRKTLCELVPALDYVAPYGRDVASFAQNVLASSANYYDATGHALRLGVSIAENAFMATPKVVKDATQKLLRSGVLSKTHKLGYDPYPGPGNIGNLTKGAGISGPDEWRYKYERVEAAC